MLTPDDKAAVRRHLAKGWKVPDALVAKLFAAYLDLEARATPVEARPLEWIVTPEAARRENERRGRDAT